MLVKWSLFHCPHPNPGPLSAVSSGSLWSGAWIGERTGRCHLNRGQLQASLSRLLPSCWCWLAVRASPLLGPMHEVLGRPPGPPSAQFLKPETSVGFNFPSPALSSPRVHREPVATTVPIVGSTLTTAHLTPGGRFPLHLWEAPVLPAPEPRAQSPPLPSLSPACLFFPDHLPAPSPQVGIRQRSRSVP